MAFGKKVAFTSAVVSILVLILSPIYQIEGLSDGAPLGACVDMTPGHGVGSQQSSSPFMTAVTNKIAESNTPIMLELRPSDSRTSFKGYLVMAFDLNDNSKPIGNFKQPNDGKLIDCGSGRMNAATHSGSTAKSSVRLEWSPPPNYSGQVVFRTTFVQNKATFWVKTVSETVSITSPAISSTVPAHTTPRSSGSLQSVSIFVNLVVLSLMTFLVR